MKHYARSIKHYAHSMYPHGLNPAMKRVDQTGDQARL